MPINFSLLNVQGLVTKHTNKLHSTELIEIFKNNDFILFIVWSNDLSVAGLGGSVGCAVRLETRRSRVQPPPRSATFFRGD